MTSSPWAALDLNGEPPYVLEQDKASLRKIEERCARKGQHFAERHRYRTNLFPDPYVGSPGAPIIVFTLNPGYTDEAKALRWRSRGCTGSDDWWHANSDIMRECYKANLAQAPQKYPLFFLDPRLQGSPGGVYYRRQFRALIELYGERRVANGVCIVEYFPYHSESFIKLNELPSQSYAIHLVREAISRDAFVVALRAKTALLAAVPALVGYEKLVTPNSPRSAVVSPGNIKRFAELSDALRA